MLLKNVNEKERLAKMLSVINSTTFPVFVVYYLLTCLTVLYQVYRLFQVEILMLFVLDTRALGCWRIAE